MSLKYDEFGNWFVWKLPIHNIYIYKFNIIFYKFDLFLIFDFIIESLYCQKKKDLFLSISISEWKNEINYILIFILWYTKILLHKIKIYFEIYCEIFHFYCLHILKEYVKYFSILEIIISLISLNKNW